ncbi:MAG: hypothetical protein H7Z10_04240 [Gemmatimonadaceae bacterium]|nr:hypothetical protein [Acetobacteraceae bacterium]
MEFALAAPALIIVMATIIDYSQMFLSRAQLVGSIAQGAEYAHLIGPTVTAASVQTVVQRALALPAANVQVEAPNCYCVAGTPAIATSQSCNTPCTNQVLPGTYTRITATYTFVSYMPLSSLLVNPILRETSLVRLK